MVAAGASWQDDSGQVAGSQRSRRDVPRPGNLPYGYDGRDQRTVNEEQQHEAWVDLPGYIEEPLEVYLNGIAQTEDVDYRRVDRSLVFQRELVAEVKMSKFQWVLVTIGIGSYKKHDSVDVIYERDGRRVVASGLPARQPSE